MICVWLSCFMCCIMKIDAWSMVVIIYCVGLLFEESNLATWGICYVLLVFSFLYMLTFLELLTSLLAYFVIPFSVWWVHHHFCNDHQDEIQYFTTTILHHILLLPHSPQLLQWWTLTKVVLDLISMLKLPTFLAWHTQNWNTLCCTCDIAHTCSSKQKTTVFI